MKIKIIYSIFIIGFIILCTFFYFHNDKYNLKKDDNNQIQSNENSNSISNTEINDNSNNNEFEIHSNLTNIKDILDNSNSNNNKTSNSNITNNNKSNITNNKSNKNIITNKIKSNTTSNKTTSELLTNGSFSGIFKNDDVKAIIFQNGNKIHVQIGKINNGSYLSDIFTSKGTISGNTVTLKSQVNNNTYKLELKNNGIKLSTNSKLKSGFIKKIDEYTKNDYFVNFMNGKLNGIRGTYTNKYGTVKIYESNTGLVIYGQVKMKNANTEKERNTYVNVSGQLSYNSKTKNWEQIISKDEYIKISLSKNNMTVNATSDEFKSYMFHIGKYIDATKNSNEPNANVYIKKDNNSVEQIINDLF